MLIKSDYLNILHPPPPQTSILSQWATTLQQYPGTGGICSNQDDLFTRNSTQTRLILLVIWRSTHTLNQCISTPCCSSPESEMWNPLPLPPPPPYLCGARSSSEIKKEPFISRIYTPSPPCTTTSIHTVCTEVYLAYTHINSHSVYWGTYLAYTHSLFWWINL